MSIFASWICQIESYNYREKMGSDDKKDAENVLFRNFFTTFDLTFTSLTLLHNEKTENSEGPFPLSKGL